MTADSSPAPCRTADFEYQLPEELIAQHPAPERSGSRLLIVPRQGNETVPLRDAAFQDFPTLVEPGDLLVVNATRVRRARLLGTRPSGAPAEVLLIRPLDQARWIAIGKPGSAMQPGKRIQLGEGIEVETVAVLEDGSRVVRFPGSSAEAAMARAGRLPLPPYIAREPTALDDARYQTVYAEHEGSVAAPTAGLHFTDEVFQAIETRGARIARLSLDVGLGTFKPVETDDPTRHPMHPERYQIPERCAALVQETRAAGGRIWAIGTTVVRALESAADDRGAVAAGPQETRLLITPGYRFRVVDRLLTNFHLPRSTLLMLVAAFAGYENTMAAYRHAVAQRYRFYSYGDAMAIL